ncbi:hypothetical protein JTB14_019736 [Gonioctena quinquepunctata]|nr:hypothetical protein JTB14_019736 [Gonioctena quinquepunctata]
MCTNVIAEAKKPTPLYIIYYIFFLNTSNTEISSHTLPVQYRYILYRDNYLGNKAGKTQHKFKCCPKKVFGNYFCIVCVDAYHPSCLERRDEIVKIKNHKILCSAECQNIFETDERKVSILNEQIAALSATLKDKDSVINQHKRRSQHFEDMVSESEQEFAAKLEEQKRIINGLQKKLHDLRPKYDNLLLEIARNEEYIQALVTDKMKLDALQKNMLTSIFTLETDNNLLQMERDKLQDLLVINNQEAMPATESPIKNKSSLTVLSAIQSSTLCSDIASVKVSATSERVAMTSSTKQYYMKPKILIIGDEIGHGWGKTFHL